MTILIIVYSNNTTTNDNNNNNSTYYYDSHIGQRRHGRSAPGELLMLYDIT